MLGLVPSTLPMLKYSNDVEFRVIGRLLKSPTSRISIRSAADGVY